MKREIGLITAFCAVWSIGYADRVNPPQEMIVPDFRHSVTQRAFTGIPSLAIAPNGRLWVTWYAGPSPAEDDNNYCVLATSEDDGRTWREVFVVDPDGMGIRRTFDPEVWVSPEGKLRWFWADRTGPALETAGTWMMTFPDANVVPDAPTPPVCVAEGVMMCKPLELSNGTWLLPNSNWHSEKSSGVTASSDKGKSWTAIGGASIPKEDRNCDEHCLVEKKNGDLWMLSRVCSGIREAISRDKGLTWTPMEKSKIRHTCSRFFIRRLQSGNLILVKHGAIDKDVGRTQLTAFLSRDDGATWEGGLLLDERNGAAYPDGDQRADGRIYITYDFNRTGAREVLFASFQEEDVLNGKNVSGKVRLQQIVSKASGRPLLPARVFPPDAYHGVDNRAHVGISSIAVSPRTGRMWATWYGGITPSEDQNNYCVLATSADGGETWKEVLVADPDGNRPRRAFDPELWISPDGMLRWTWTDRIGTVGSDPAYDQLWMLVIDSENEPPAKLPSPQYVGCGVMMCKPIVLSSGEWLFPLAQWQKEASSCVYASTDGGKTFALRGGASMPLVDRLFDEHMLVEKKNGDLWCLSRSKTGIREAISRDKGATWSPLEYMKNVKHTSSRFFIRRLQSGHLLLVKHGPVDQDVGRKLLAAYLSRDDGATWEGGLMLDERERVSYPDGQQTADGTIYITYDYDRTRSREVYFCTFREEDILAGKDVSGKVRMRRLISKSRGYPTVGLPKPADNQDGIPISVKGNGVWRGEGYASAPLRSGALLFTDRHYEVAEGQLPQNWKNVKFLRIPLEGKQTISCAKAGVLGVLTPMPARNRDSLQKSLEDQGFRRVALPEIRLFDPRNPGNLVTLFQKQCAEGETVVVGKWGVPVWFE
ncbi:MAG: exo-alpha-sialidase [Kiritimatiellae bacterium]|nr:exo-alpha-sialidase [Kiritimatiellia bacterium]